MSSDEDFESEEGEDFSCSEDEWQPPPEELEIKRPRKEFNLRKSGKIINPNRSMRRKSVSLISNRFKTRKVTFGKVATKRNDDGDVSEPPPADDGSQSESESSGDDCLVDPTQLDLRSSFFDVSRKANDTETAPVFDCNAGTRLSSDSEREDEDDDNQWMDIDENGGPTAGCSKDLAPQMDFKHLQDFATNLQNAKDHLKKKALSAKAVANDAVNISDLLAMGETGLAPEQDRDKPSTSTSSSKSRKRAATQRRESLSDWEEVDEEEPSIQSADIKDIQITVDLPTHQRKDKKAIDLEASLKRRINRNIKENQLYLHKVSLLCHISGGIHCNKVLNHPVLMAEALKILPNKTCYPDGRTEIKYFESMIKWYRTRIRLKRDKMFAKMPHPPPLEVILGLQIKYKHAICKKHYILIFIIILRAMGIQCRLVQNLLPLPIRPPQSDLCTIKMAKNEPDNSMKQETKSEKPKTEKKSSKIEKVVEEKRDESIKNIKSSEKASVSGSKPKSEKMPKEDSSVKSSEKASVSGSKPKLEKKPKEDSGVKRVKTDLDSSGRSKDIKKESPKKHNTRKLAESSSLSGKLKSEVKTKPSHSSNSPEITKPAKKSLSEKLSLKPQPLPKVVVTKEKIEKNSRPKKETSSTSVRDRSKSPSMKVMSKPSSSTNTSRAKSPDPKVHISAKFLQNSLADGTLTQPKDATRSRSKSPSLQISPKFLQKTRNVKAEKAEEEKLSQRTRSRSNKLTIPQVDGADDALMSGRKKPNLKKLSVPPEKRKPSRKADSDEEFEPSPPKKARSTGKKPTAVEKIKNRDRRILSTDLDDDDVKKATKKSGNDIWVEVYCEMEEQWICIDLFKEKVHCVDHIRRSATSNSLAYVLAWNNDDSIKDVTARYCLQWHTTLQKSRVEQVWLDDALHDYKGRKTARDKCEDEELRKIHLDKPLPTAIAEYKNHPLYALERHLLKFQAIYPPNALTMGFVRGNPVYARECVHTLHSRDIWLKSARVVKLGEQPYKIVKARPKWDRLTNTCIKDQPLEIFGYWQTMDYDPPTAENGIVPRNAYGNVELFKKCMLPKKTVHLQLPGLNRICKKLRIDCAPAVVGFDFHQGSCHPMYDGFVVCEEFGDQVVAAWYQDVEEAEKKEEDKYLARVYGNWKKLIRGLQIRERLKLKYNFQLDPAANKKPKKSKKAT